MKNKCCTFAFLVVFLFSSAQLLPADNAGFTLSSYVPADMHFLVNWKYTPQRARLFASCEKAFGNLVASGIGRDIIDLATIEASEHSRREVYDHINRAISLITTPNWKALTGKEMAVAFKFQMPVPEYVVLFKVQKKTAGKRLEEFATMFKAVADLVPQIMFIPPAENGEKTVRLTFGVPFFSLAVTAEKDMIILSTSDRALGSVLSLVNSKEKGGAIVDTEKFQNAFKGLHKAEDSITYFDSEAYLHFYKQILDMAHQQAGGGGMPGAETLFFVLDAILREVSCFTAIGGVEYTEGNTIYSDSRITISQKAGTGFIENLIREQKPVADFPSAVPQNAVTAYSTSGVEPSKVYDAIVGLIKQTEQGERILGAWEHLQRKIGFNLREDLYSWVQGEFGFIMLPAKRCSCEGIFYLRVKDDKKAKALIQPLLDKGKQFLHSRGQRVSFVTIPNTDNNFFEIRIEAMPFCRPVIGFPHGSFVICSSRKTLDLVSKTLFQKSPNIRKNPRFADLKLPEGHVIEVYYQDIRGALKGMADMVGTAGFVASIMPKDRETKPILKLGSILTKLSRFLREIDLGVAMGSWTRYDPDEHALFGRQMIKLLRRKKM